MSDLGNLAHHTHNDMQREVIAAICARWELVLGEPPVSIDTAFFDAGGDSAAAVELALLVDEVYPGCVEVLDFFDHPTISALAKLVIARRNGERAMSEPAQSGDEAGSEVAAGELNVPTTVARAAVVGLTCCFPSVADEEAFWRLLCEGRSTLAEIPARRWQRPTDPEIVWVGALFPDIERFDARSFGLARRDAVRTDPQQHLLLEASRELVQASGLVDRLAASRTGVFIGATQSGFGEMPSPDAWLNGRLTSLLANRISYHYDLRGPSEVVDTACSSSLVAVHRALCALSTGECDLAIAGGISLMVTPSRYLMMARNGMLSPSGACRPFDEHADGMVPGEGVALVMLARLDDALAKKWRVRAIIRGSATGSDGHTNGINAPRAEAQVQVLTEAWRRAAVSPSELSYIEAHGTATPLGDPIEARALAAAFDSGENGRRRRQPCVLGSVKGNLGHVEWAAGVAGLVKVILALEHREIPPTAGFERASPLLDLDPRAFSIPTAPVRWSGPAPRRAGVSSFGAGGTNCHVVVEEASEPKAPTYKNRLLRQSSAAEPDRPHSDNGMTSPQAVTEGKGPAEGLLYTPVWREGSPHKRQPLARTVLLAGGTGGLRQTVAKALRASGFDVVLVSQESTAGDGHQLDALFADLPQPLSAVAWLGACEPAQSFATDVTAAAERALAVTVELSRLLAALARRGGLRHALAVTRQAQTLPGDDPGGPELAAVSGVLRGAAAELQDLQACWLDVPAGAEPEHIAQAVTRELLGATEGTVAYRQDKRLEQRWTVFADAGSMPPRLPDGSVYLLTGALGGIGLALAKHLAESTRARLVLLSRTRLPPREKWEFWVEQGDPQEATTQRLRHLLDIEELGGQILTLQTDVSDRQALAQAVTAACKRFGHINAVIHAAGVLEDSLLVNLDRERCAAVLAPKVSGAWALREAFKADPPELVALCSTASTVFGNAGQANYLAANACLDSLAAAWGSSGQRVVTINWSTWANVGMAAASGHAARSDRLGFPPLEMREALAAFDTAIRSNSDRVLVARLSNARRQQLLGDLDAGQPSAQESVAERCPANQPSTAQPPPKRTHEQIAELIADILAAQLHEPPGSLVHDTNFFDLGASSLDLVTLVEQLSERLGWEITPTACYEHPTISSLAAQLVGQWPEKNLSSAADVIAPERTAAGIVAPKRVAAGEGKRGAGGYEDPEGMDIAIIALACRLPGAASPEELWRLLAQNADAVVEIPPSRWDVAQWYDPDPSLSGHTISKWAGLLDDIEGFDPLLFRVSPLEAARMDPHQRLALELAWEVFERAGYGADSHQRRQTGVFLGVEPSEYAALGEVTVNSATSGANSSCMAANRVSYLFNLTGPSLVVDTACSSSALAVHLACRALAASECRLAIAGGVKVLIGPRGFVVNSAARMLSPTGRCHTFDDRADGYVRAEGAGVVLLKPLSQALHDGDQVLAVIKATSTCHDGNSKAGLTAPNPDAQRELLLDAWARARVDPRTIGYVEAHGTGTALGDPLEVEALCAALRAHTPDTGFCAVGSIKANIGHAEAAAGIAGLIKVVLALQHEALPPTPHLRYPNHRLDWDVLPIRLLHEQQPWTAQAGIPRRAGVSAFGFGGANVHIVVEEAPPPQPAPPRATRPHVYPLSGRTVNALRRSARQLHSWVSEHHQLRLEDVATTLAYGRAHLTQRAAIVAADRQQLLEGLDALARGRASAYLYGPAQPDAHDPRVSPSASSDTAPRGAHDESVVTSSQDEAVLRTVASSYVGDGQDIDWQRAGCKGSPRVLLPTYPFERQRCWIGTASEPAHSSRVAPAVATDTDAARRSWLLKKAWRPVEVQDSTHGAPDGAWLTVGDDEGVFGHLRRICATAAGTLHRCAESLPAFGNNLLGEQDQLSLPEGVRGAVVFSGPIDEQLPQALHVLGNLMDRIAHTGQPGITPRLVLAVRGAAGVVADEAVRPVAAALAAGARALAHERPEVSTAVVDLGDLPDEQAAGWLAAAMAADQAWDGAIRDGGLWVAQFTPADEGESASPTPLQDEPLSLRGEGVYVVAGGSGGVGGVIAQMLVQRGAQRVLLLSRTCPPPAGDKRFIARSADIADREALCAALEEARALYGPIRGVVHAAGVMDFLHRTLRSKTPASIADVLTVKVMGTRLLHELTQDDPLDLFLLCTSISGVFGALGAGQVDYAAANAFQDAYASARNGPGRSLAIAWPRWAEVGMGVGRPVPKLMEELGIGLLGSQDAVCLLGAALQGSLDHRAVVLPHRDPVATASQLLALMPARPGRSPAPEHARSASQPVPATDGLPKLEDWLRTTVAAQLGLSAAELDPRTGLDAYGIDSLNVVDILGAIEQRFGAVLAPSIVLEHGSVARLAVYLHERFGAVEQDSSSAFEVLSPGTVDGPASTSSSTATAPQTDTPGWPTEADARSHRADISGARQNEPLAIVGIACRMPGGGSPTDLWEMISARRSAVAELPPDRWRADETFWDPSGRDPTRSVSKWGGFLPDAGDFDPVFFGLSKESADAIDPLQRLFLEAAWNVLEDGGYASAERRPPIVGVFAGARSELRPQESAVTGVQAAVGYAQNFIAARAAQTLDLRGPAIVVDTACSSSLVAVHMAAASLRGDECDMAIAGGVDLLLSAASYIALSAAGALSPDGRCWAFDVRANGYVPGEGVGAVLLRPLSQALAAGDRIYALLLGSALNNDGRTMGVTTPSVQAQREVLRRAYAQAGISPASLSYVEAHGTGTAIGDPVETQALREVLAEAGSTNGFCGLGSIKTNIGHLHCAAGIASLLKVVLALHHGQLPPTLNCERPNPRLELEGSPLDLTVEGRPWPRTDRPRRAGVSSFGFGGTNCHAVIEEAPLCEAQEEPGPHLLALSARDEPALCRRVDQLADSLRRASGWSAGAVCRSLSTGRGAFEHRLAMWCSDAGQLAEQIAYLQEDPNAQTQVARGHVPSERPARIAFLYPGQGAQQSGMGRALYETQPVFRSALDCCASACGLPLQQLLFDGDRQTLDRTDVTQPAVFAIEYALTELLRSWGVVPDIVVGHSIGEYAAACAAGMLSVQDASRIVGVRGRLMVVECQPGAMLAVSATEEEVKSFLPSCPGVEIALVNAERSVVVGGSSQAVDRFREAAEQSRIRVQPLRVSHAFHTELMEPMLAQFAAVAEEPQNGRSTLRYISGSSGREIELADAHYWVSHVRQPVRFAQAVRHLSELQPDLIVEVGPGRVLTTLVRPALASGPPSRLVPLLASHSDERTSVVRAAAEMWVAGAPLDPAAVAPGSRQQSPLLPTYPFARVKCALPIDAPSTTSGHSSTNAGGSRWGKRFSTREPAVADHTVAGRFFLPGVTWIDGAAQALGSDKFTLLDLTFLTPLECQPGSDRQATLLAVADTNGKRRFSGTSHGDDPSNELVHVRGELAIEAPDATTVEVAQLRGRMREQRVPEEVYDIIRACGITHGPYYRSLRRVHLGDGEALAELELTAQAHAADTGPLHPALLDAATTAGAALGVTGSGWEPSAEPFIPFHIERVEVLRPLPTSCLAWYRLRSARAEVIVFDLDLIDEQGSCCVRFHGFTSKRFRHSANGYAHRQAGASDRLLAAIEWSVARPVGGGVGDSPLGVHGPAAYGPLVLLADTLGISERIETWAAQRRIRVVHVQPGERFEALDANRYQIAHDDAGHFLRILQDVKRSCDDKPLTVVHAWSCSAKPINSLATLERRIDLGVQSLLALAGALAQDRGEALLRILTTDAYSVSGEPAPGGLEAACVIGLSRCLPWELPNVDVCSIDVPSADREAWEHVPTELAGPAQESLVALRKEQRSVARIVPVTRLPAVSEGPADTCVITGGLGGIGMALAKHLADGGLRRFAFIQRGDERAHPEAAPGLQQLRSRGCSVLLLRADIGEAASLAPVLERVRRELGPIRTVVHAAGLLRDGLLRSKSQETLRAVLHPKVRGTWLLDALTASDPVGHFLLCSSISALYGAFGQGDYAAANAFLGAFAEQRSRSRRGLTRAIDWSLWDGVGMGSEREIARRFKQSGRSPLQPAQAMQAFDATLALHTPEVVIETRTDIRQLGRHGAGETPVNQTRPVASAGAHEASEQTAQRGRAGAEGAIVLQTGPLASTGAQQQEPQEVAQALVASETAKLLDVAAAQVDISAEFLSLGLDSAQIVELADRLGQILGCPLYPTLLFEHVTIQALAWHLAAAHPDALLRAARKTADSPPQAAPPSASISVPQRSPARAARDIAVIALAGRFPGAGSPAALWDIVKGGCCQVSDATAELSRRGIASNGHNHARFAAMLDGVEEFDPLPFKITPREAPLLDPQHRLVLETVWELFERAGRGGRAVPRNTGVFVGVMNDDYRWEAARARLSLGVGSGTSPAIIANRISYTFDLDGPSMPVETACSSSLVALHLACESLRRDEAKLAIAGGVNVLLSAHWFDEFAAFGMLSPTGRCHTFGKDADGYVRGEGVAAVLLKPLQDAQRDGDTIHAVITGSASNHNGRTNGISAPNPASQAEVILSALRAADITPAGISYVEAHGTGTSLGDPVEIEGLMRAYGSHRDQPASVAIGSVKENIGHLEAAAGIAGLAKVVLCIRHRTLPPSLAAQRPNPLIPFEKGPFRTPAVPEPWEGPRPLRAGLSSFGFGGANAHVIVQEPPLDTAPPTPARRAEALLLSARTAPALSKLASELHDELSGRDQWSLADVCATLSRGRTHFTHRLTAVVSCKAELFATLDRVRGKQLGDAQRQQPAAHAQPTLLLGGGWHDANGSLGRKQDLLLGQHELLDRALTGWQEAIWRCGDVSEPTHNAQLATVVGAALECLLAWGAKLSACVAGGPALIGAAVACEALDRATAGRLLSNADFSDERVGQRPATTLIGPLGPIEAAQPWSWWQAAANPSRDRAETLVAGQHSLRPGTVAALVADSPAEWVGEGGLLASWSDTDDPWAGLLKILAALHQADGTIDWDAFERPRSHRRIELPVPDFERSRHWIFDDIDQAHRVDPAKGVHAAHDIDTSHGPPAQSRQQSKDAQVCAVTWQVHADHDTPRGQLTGGWLVLGPEALSHKVASRLKQAGAQTIAQPPQRQLPATEQDLASMLDDLGRQSQSINGICLLDGCSAKPVEPDTELRRGMGVLHAVVGALRMRKEHGAVEVWAFTTAGSDAPGARRPLVPMRAALGAFGTVVAQEDRDSRLHVIDLAGEDDTAVANEVAEAIAHPTLPTTCALRKGQAWTPCQLPLGDIDVQAHDGEVWWITGGLGDLGLDTARLLAARGARSVILTSRKTLPPRAAWDEQRAREGALGERLDRLLDIERYGATVTVMPADVADELAMQSILESILDRHDALHGVIHAAGIAGRGQRAHRLTEDQLASVFRAKVDGAMVLDRLTAEVGLRHFICFSSTAALVGGIGFADYAAANASLDLLMAARRDAGSPATTINWAAWAKAGLNASSSTGLGRRQATLAPQAAIAALDRILALSPGQYAVTAADEIDNQRGMDTPSEVTALANGSSSSNGVRDGAIAPGGARVPSDALVEIVKSTIAQIIASDPSEFDSQTPLEDLGFDSRIALELIDALEERFEIELPLELMANAPTAMALANAISGQAGEAPPDDALVSPEGTGENGAGRELVLALAPDIVARSFRGGQVPYVLCFPPAGGQALGFRAFARALPEQWQVWGLDPPGHGLAVPPARTRIEDIAQCCTAVLRSRLGSSAVLVGHSLGGLTALEVARSLIAEGLDSLVVLYGTPPPDRLSELAAVADRDDQSLLDWLHWLGGVPDKVMRYPELVARSLPALRADLRACERYRPPAGEPISAPTLICAGEEDLLLRGVDLEQWSRYVASPKIVMLPGNHFSIVDSPNAAAAAVASWVTATHIQEIRSRTK